MRQILFFDLPVETSEQRKAYRTFVKGIKELGFYMLQKSVYVKLNVDARASDSTLTKVKSQCPKKGEISILTITEKQFASIDMIIGSFKTDVVNSDERIIEL